MAWVILLSLLGDHGAMLVGHLGCLDDPAARQLSHLTYIDQVLEIFFCPGMF